jgi:hypothetical protein
VLCFGDMVGSCAFLSVLESVVLYGIPDPLQDDDVLEDLAGLFKLTQLLAFGISFLLDV